MMPKDPAAAMLSAALEVVTQRRREDYGSAEDNFGHIAALWNTYINERLRRGECIEEDADECRREGNPYPTNPRPIMKRGRMRLDAVDIALLMDLMKTARLISKAHHYDSWLDKAGYSGCGWRCAVAEGLADRPTKIEPDHTTADASPKPYA